MLKKDVPAKRVSGSRPGLPKSIQRSLATACVLAVAAILMCVASEWSVAAGAGVDDSVTVQIRKWTAPPAPIDPERERLTHHTRCTVINSGEATCRGSSCDGG